MGPSPKKGMSGWGIAMLIMAGFGLVVVALAVGGYLWWRSNKDRLISETKDTQHDARTYGASHAQDDCVEEGLRRADNCDGVWCKAQEQLFVQACLPRAKKTPGFCDGVPKPNEIGNTATWIVDECRRRNREKDAYCRQVVQGVPQYCKTVTGSGG